MLNKNMRNKEISGVLEKEGDFVKIDYLSRYLKENPPIEMRKFAYSKLAEIYSNKKMFSEVAKMYRNISINSLTFREKRENYLKESKAYILAKNFEASDKALKKAMAEGNSKEKEEIYEKIINFYENEGKKLENQKKPGATMKIYEILIRKKLSEEKYEEIRKKLLNLYDKLGKRKEIGRAHV